MIEYKLTMKEEVLEILKDGAWHNAEEFIHLGWSFRSRFPELKEQGYHIISEKQKDKKTFRYRLMQAFPESHFSTESPTVPVQSTLFPMTQNWQ